MKDYLLKLLELCSDENFGQEAVEYAIFSGQLKLTCDLQTDLQTIMGEPGRPVEITYWRATWQATVDGRGDSIRDIYPRATVDHYPFEAASLKEGSPAQHEMALRYAPARALGNSMAGPRTTPVQDLVAEGPGTISPAPNSENSGSRGCGKRTAEGWAVVIVRRLPAGLSANTPSQVAVAVWQGAEEEAGPRKMRTGWIPLTLETKP